MKNKKFQTRNVLTISFAHFVHDTFSSFLAPILPLIIEKFNISLSMAGLLTIFQRVPSLLNPLVGIIADKSAVRLLLTIAPSVTALSMSLIGVADNYILLSLLLMTAGIGASLFHVPSPVMIKEISGSRVGKGMSFFMLGGESARSIGPLLVLGAVSYWGLKGTVYLLPLGLSSSLLLYFRLRNIPVSKKTEARHKEHSLKKTLKINAPVFIQIAGIVYFTALIRGSLTTYLPVFLTGEGESLWFGGISLSVIQLAGAAGTFLSGTISDKIGRTETLLYSSISAPILMLAYIYLPKLYSIPLLLLIGILVFASVPVLLAFVNEIDSEHPSFINGIFMTINFLVGGAGTFTIGVLGDLVGLESAYLLSAILGFAAVPFIIRLSNK